MVADSPCDGEMMVPDNAQQVREELNQISALTAKLGEAVTACQEFSKMQVELIGRLNPDSGIPKTSDYSEAKYANCERTVALLLRECVDLIEGYLGPQQQSP